MSHRTRNTGAVLLLAGIVGLLAWGALRVQPGRQDAAPLKPGVQAGTPGTDAPGGVGPESAAPFPTGYRPNPEGTQEFLRTLDEPLFRDAGKDLIRNRGPPPEDGARASEPVLLYRALYRVQPTWIVGRQGIGDCVSWGWAHAADILLAVDVTLGRSAEWHAAATEAIYGGSRVEARGRTSGGWSDGSYGGAAAKWVSQWGIVFRQEYPSFGHDLTKYSADRAKQWGNYGCGGRGDDGRFDAEAKRHAIKTVALVTNFAEAAAAIENGYPIPVCSGQGFSSTRDKDGFCKASGSWAHCMCFIGVRYDREGLLCLNSWGPNWVKGPKWPTGEGYDPNSPRGPPAAQPDGSFWVERSVVDRMLRGRDSFAVSNYQGFPARKLKHSEGW